MRSWLGLSVLLSIAGCTNRSDVPEPAHGCDEFALGKYPDSSMGGGGATLGYVRVFALPLATAASSSATRLADACRGIAESDGRARPEDDLPTLCAHAREALDGATALGLRVDAPAPRCLLSVAEHQECLAMVANEYVACSERVPRQPPDVFTCVDGSMTGHCNGACVDPASQMEGACGPVCPSAFQADTCSGVAIRGGCDDHEEGRVPCDAQVAALADCETLAVTLTGGDGVSSRLRTALTTNLPALVETRASLRLIGRYLESFTAGVTARNDYDPRCAPNVRGGAQYVHDSLATSRNSVENVLTGIP